MKLLIIPEVDRENDRELFLYLKMESNKGRGISSRNCTRQNALIVKGPDEEIISLLVGLQKYAAAKQEAALRFAEKINLAQITDPAI